MATADIGMRTNRITTMHNQSINQINDPADDPDATTVTTTGIVLELPQPTQSTSVPSNKQSTNPPVAYAPFDHFISGITAGSLSTLMLHPFDLIKTKMQMAQGPVAQSLNHSIDQTISRARAPRSYEIASSVIRQDGVFGLWRGLVPNLTGNTLAWGFYFFGYNALKNKLQETLNSDVSPNQPVRHLQSYHYLLCAALTGSCVQAITNPVWVVKTLAFLDSQQPILPGQPQTKPSLVRALIDLYRTEGIAGLYRGFVPGLFGVSHGAVQFMTYDSIKRRWLERQKQKRIQSGTFTNDQTNTLSPLATLSMACFSKVVASVSTYPYQVIRTHMQARGVEPPYKSSVDCITRLYNQNGMRGLYRGAVVGTVKVIPHACAVFLIYETVDAALKRRAAQKVADTSSVHVKS